MNIANYKNMGERIEFDVTGMDVGLLNAFRRTIISGIPVMAVEKITFYDNTTILNDENLAHRIGLVPLTTDLKTYTLRGECTCKGQGCAKCTALLTIDVPGPGTLFSGQIKSKDENVKPAYDKIPLVKLTPEQSVKCECEAILGYGSEHVKWQPGIASYEIKDKDKKSYHVIVETYGPLPVQELVDKGLEVVEQKLKELGKELK